MIENPASIITDFLQATSWPVPRSGPGAITHERQAAPHEPHRLPDGKCAVYVFSLSTSYGSRCPAGANRALKVGRVGPNSSPRFQYQHYKPRSAGSNLSRSLLRAQSRWPYLGISVLNEAQVEHWIKENVDRDHFYLEGERTDLCAELERYIRARLGPVFEGG